MNERTLKRKRGSTTMEPNKMVTTDEKKLNFTDLCIEIIRKKIDDLTLGKFFVKSLRVVKKLKNY